MVSIICNTYNHEPFIKDALDSFVMQKTTFPFEVLVHDDASTDNTAEIIRVYEARYPNLIKPVYETENQYSKRNGAIGKIQYGRAHGKYIALCEGDDYWTDPLKLQKQFDAMEDHPEIDMCSHAASMRRDDKILGVISPRDRACVIPVENVISGGGGFFATNSIFYRRSMREITPKFAQYLSFDYTLQIWGALRGGILYLPDIMSVYRVAVPGSWTVRMKSEQAQMDAHTERVNKMLAILNEETDGKYDEVISEHIAQNEASMLARQGKYDEIKRGRLKDYYRRLPLKKKMRLNGKQLLWYFGVKE